MAIKKRILDGEAKKRIAAFVEETAQYLSLNLKIDVRYQCIGEGLFVDDKIGAINHAPNVIEIISSQAELITCQRLLRSSANYMSF